MSARREAGFDGTVRTVLFDAGNTLLHLDFPRIGRIARRLGISASAPTLARAELRARRLIDTPQVVSKTDDRVRWLRYFRAILEGTRMTEDSFQPLYRALEAEHARENLWSRRAPDAIATLGALTRRGYRLGVVSNADGRIEGLLERAGLRGFFGVVVDSKIVGVEKPDPRIFRPALEALGALPRETAYVGDLFHVDVAGAERGGIFPILLDPTGSPPRRACSTIRRLRDLLDLFPASARGSRPGHGDGRGPSPRPPAP